MLVEPCVYPLPTLTGYTDDQKGVARGYRLLVFVQPSIPESKGSTPTWYRMLRIQSTVYNRLHSIIFFIPFNPASSSHAL